MLSADFIQNIVDNKLMDLHTAYIGKVLTTNGTTATVQPLGKYKQYGESAKDRAPISNIPVIKQARNKVTAQDITIDGVAYKLGVLTPITSGDIVLCVCCERDISQAKKGVNTLPAIGHHSMSDSVVVGIL